MAMPSDLSLTYKWNSFERQLLVCSLLSLLSSSLAIGVADLSALESNSNNSSKCIEISEKELENIINRQATSANEANKTLVSILGPSKTYSGTNRKKILKSRIDVTGHDIETDLKASGMAKAYETRLKDDPAIWLLVMQNSSTIFVIRRVNKYYYWKSGQTAGAAIIFCMILVGNLSILHRVRSSRRRRSNVNYFIVQLAIADLFVGVFNVTLDSMLRLQREFTYGLFACRASKYISVVFIYSSTYLLVALSIDRWEAVVKPLAFTRNRKRGYYLVASAWLLALLSALPVTLRTRIKMIDGLAQCYIDLNLVGWKIYILYVTSTVLVIPAIIIAICYAHIVYTIWSKSGGQPVSELEKPIPCCEWLLPAETNHLADEYEKADYRLVECQSHSSPALRWTALRDSPVTAAPKSLALASLNSGLRAEVDSENAGGTAGAQSIRSDYLSTDEDEMTELGHIRLDSSSNRRLQNINQEINCASTVTTQSDANRLGQQGSPNSNSNGNKKQCHDSHEDKALTPKLTTVQKHGTGVIPKARIKTIKMTLVIVAAFILCWSPFCLINLCSVFGLMPSNTSLSIALMTLSQSLAHLNSAMNPIIFWLFSSKRTSTSKAELARTSGSSFRSKLATDRPDELRRSTIDYLISCFRSAACCYKPSARPIVRNLRMFEVTEASGSTTAA